jgi:hypothetical protein
MAKPHPRNVDGPFYVEDQCCTACGVPDDCAPGFFAWEDLHCYVSRQPATAEELEQMLDALQSAELDCIRYRGDDVAILRRLTENGLGECCDLPPPQGASPIVRTHVAFRLSAVWRDPARALAADFRDHLRRQNVDRTYRSYRVKPTWRSSVVQFSWFRDFHTVWFSRAEGRPERWLAHHGSERKLGGRAVSRVLHDWLSGSPRYADVRGFTADQWRAGEEGAERPS